MWGTYSYDLTKMQHIRIYRRMLLPICTFPCAVASALFGSTIIHTQDYRLWLWCQYGNHCSHVFLEIISAKFCPKQWKLEIFVGPTTLNLETLLLNFKSFRQVSDTFIFYHDMKIMCFEKRALCFLAYNWRWHLQKLTQTQWNKVESPSHSICKDSANFQDEKPGGTVQHLVTKEMCA